MTPRNRLTTKQRAKVPLMLRLPVNLHKMLVRRAKREGTSLNSQIVTRLLDSFFRRVEPEVVKAMLDDLRRVIS